MASLRPPQIPFEGQFSKCELFNPRYISGEKSSFQIEAMQSLLLKKNFKFSLNLLFYVSFSHQHPSGYGTYPSATHQAAGHHCATSSLPRSAPGTLGWPRSSLAKATSSSSCSSSSSSSQLIQQRISVPPNSSKGH